MIMHPPCRRVLTLLTALVLCFRCAGAQDSRGPDAHTRTPPTDPRALVQRAVQTELKLDREDQSRWRYRDEERDKHLTSIVVQTDAGAVKRLVARNGHLLSADDVAAENDRLTLYIHDTAKLAKQKRDSESDDRSAAKLIAMLPDAFVWTPESESPDTTVLHFEPNPRFAPPDMEARVLSTMRGELAIDRRQFRIRTIRGTLTSDVMIGFGILGRLRQGGSFQVERREVAPGLWQITETHVHIEGKALMFKNIDQQQDEVQTDFQQVPGKTSLEQAVAMSRPGPDFVP